MVDKGNKKHLTDLTGVAVCGLPARQDHLVSWGDADCAHCIALYRQRAQGRPH